MNIVELQIIVFLVVKYTLFSRCARKVLSAIGRAGQKSAQRQQVFTMPFSFLRLILICENLLCCLMSFQLILSRPASNVGTPRSSISRHTFLMNSIFGRGNVFQPYHQRRRMTKCLQQFKNAVPPRKDKRFDWNLFEFSSI